MNFLMILMVLINTSNNFANPFANLTIQMESKQDSSNKAVYKRYEFTINNDVSSEFSYIDGDLYDGGIKSVLIDKDYCFFVDEIHCNVKRISLKDGIKTVSKTLMNSTGRSLVDITIHNGLIYVSSCKDEIFVLDSSLNLIKTLVINTNGHNELLFKGSRGDNLLVLINVQDTLLEIDTLGMEVDRQKVTPYYKSNATLNISGIQSDKIFTAKIITTDLDEKLYYYTIFNQNEFSFIRNKKYVIKQEGSKTLFINQSNEIPLLFKYRHLGNTDIDLINDLDFNDTYLVYYEISVPLFIVHVYSMNK